MTLSHPRIGLPRPLRALAATLVLGAACARAQTPTPTPTPTPTTTPGVTSLPVGSSLWQILNGGSYDGENIVLDKTGVLWSVSATTNTLARLSADRLTLTQWTFATDTAPSSILPDTDGTLWLTELGGFRVAHFDPATGNLTEYPDGFRRPTALARRADGKYFLPETGGYLAVFDPGTPSFSYYVTPGIFYLSYPYQDADGSLWSCDFVYGTIVHWAPDLSTARLWPLPLTVDSPAKIVRLSDGKLWISFFTVGEIGRFDDTTGQLDVFSTGAGTFPFDLHSYRRRILYSDQSGSVGFLDPATAPTVSTDTLTSTDKTPYLYKTVAATTVASTLTSSDLAMGTPTVDVIPGAQWTSGSAVQPANLAAIYGLAVDEEHARIYFSTYAALGVLRPPPSQAATDLYLATTAAGSPAPGTTTQFVTWNRGTPDSSGASHTLNASERLLPDGWITGWSPATLQTVDAGKLLVQTDVVGTDMNAPGAFGGTRVTSDHGADTFVWSRVSSPAPGGGTFGFAANAVDATAAIQTGDSGFLFTPGDASLKTHAGVFITQDATGTLSIVDASGKTLAAYAFDWPAGYRVEASTIFDAFGLPAVPSARVVCAVTTGSVLLFGTAYDPVSGDAVRLEAFRSGDAGLWPTFPGFVRGTGIAPSLQLFNPGSSAAHVAVSFRPAGSGVSAVPGQALGTTTVPPGAVVTLDLSGPAVQGALDLSSDQNVVSFATYRRSTPNGSVLWSVAAQQLAAAVTPGQRGVFLASTVNDAFASTLQLVNAGFDAATVMVTFTAADGSAAGSQTVSLAPQSVVNLPAWPSGQQTDMGRVDVTPADGSTPVLALLARRDRVSQDTDAILPFVIPR